MQSVPSLDQPNLPPRASYVALGYLRGAVEYVRLRDLPIEPLLAAMEVEEADLERYDCYIPARFQDDLFAAAEAVTGDRNVGLHVGQAMHPGNLGALSGLLLTCSRGGELFDLHERFGPLVSNCARAEYELLDEGVRLTMYRADPAYLYGRHLIEFNLAGWWTLARWIGGQQLSPTRIEWPFVKPDDVREQQRFFGCEMSWCAPTFRVWFDRSLVDLPLRNGQPGLRAVVEPEIRRRLNLVMAGQEGSVAVVARARRHVADLLSRLAPELGDVATALGMSTRQLQRHLVAGGTTYRDLLDGVRRELAAHYVREGRLPLADIALLVGFAEQSTFQRAFRRWFDCTPGEYRRTAVI
jgi:AraC-like DNA-binding protein